MSANNLKFGIFLAPFHTLKENPTIALERDLELIDHLDSLNYDYAPPPLPTAPRAGSA